LYVGISISVLQRLKQHQKSHWWRSISHVTFERFNSRNAALLAEQTAIKKEKPLHNIQGAADADGEETEKLPSWDPIEDCTQWQCNPAGFLGANDAGVA
jgi:hypothetical protein